MKSITVLFTALLLLVASAIAAETAPAFTAKVTGRGHPMILIPGLSCPGEVWDSTVAHFKDRYECHVLSLAGFAGTPPLPADTPFLASARDAIAAYIRDRKLHRPIVVGHSLGGFITLDLASNSPSLTGPLVIVDAAPFIAALVQPGATREQARNNASHMRRFFDNMDAATYEQTIRAGSNTRPMVKSEDDHSRIVAWSLASDRSTVANAMSEMFGTDLREDLVRIDSPTLVFASWIAYQPYTDRTRIEKSYREQYSRLRDVNIAVTDTARHFIMFDDPQWLFTEIETFLSRHIRASK